MSAESAAGDVATFGDSLAADSARLRVTVLGGRGQRLRYLRNGRRVLEVPINADPFEQELAIERATGEEGPLGTFWRVETADDRSVTTIGNPIFLRGGS